MQRWLVPALLACALAGAARAQDPACVTTAQLTHRHLHGLWRAEFEDGGAGATLLLGPHREYAESLSGELNRNGDRSRVAADLEDGELTLEESADGVRISATWLGEVVEGSCGREIRGRYQAGGEGVVRNFRLRRVAAW